ncbi:MAG: hypothetical protein U0231_12525 [Nitrospiraceae bacterium]
MMNSTPDQPSYGASSPHRGQAQTYIPIPTEYSTQKKLYHELTLFGFPLHCHPLDLFTDALAGTSRILAKDLDQYVGKEVT